MRTEDPENAQPRAWPPDEEPNELVERLRSLRWPAVSDEVRQRCWEQLTRDLPELDPPPRPASELASDSPLDDSVRPGSRLRWKPDGDTLHERRFGRHEFASRGGRLGYHGALGQRVATARVAVRSPVR